MLRGRGLEKHILGQLDLFFWVLYGLGATALRCVCDSPKYAQVCLGLSQVRGSSPVTFGAHAERQRRLSACAQKEAAQQQQAVSDDDDDEVVVASPKKRRLKKCCLLYTSPSPRDATLSRMPSSA